MYWIEGFYLETETETETYMCVEQPTKTPLKTEYVGNTSHLVLTGVIVHREHGVTGVLRSCPNGV